MSEGGGAIARMPDSVLVPVAVLAERRPAVTAWADWVWQVVEVLEEVPEGVAPWTLLREAEGRSLFFAGVAEVALHPTDTSNYRENLAADPPRIWAVLRRAEASPSGLMLQAVTIDPGEAEVFADSGDDLMESLPMPPGLRALAEAFVARHHVERQFHKRRRDRADLEALGRRGPRGARRGEDPPG